MQRRLPGTLATPVLWRHSFIPTLFGPGHRTPQLTTRCNGSCHWEDTIGSAGFGHGRSSLTRTTWFITGDGHCAWWCLNRAMADSLSLTLTPCGAAEGRRSRSTGKVALVRCTRRLTGFGCFYSRPVYSSTSAGFGCDADSPDIHCPPCLATFLCMGRFTLNKRGKHEETKARPGPRDRGRSPGCMSARRGTYGGSRSRQLASQ